MIPDQPMPSCPCPWCGYVLDAAENATSPGQGGPSPGSVSICCECAGLLVFTDDLTVRQAILDDVAEMDDDQRITFQRARAFILDRKLERA
jgi:hypothetical protein